MGQIIGANYLLLGSSRSGKSHYGYNHLFRKQPPALYIDPKNTDTYLREAAVQADCDGFYSVDWLKNREPVPYYILRGHPQYDLDAEVQKALEWVINSRVRNPNAPQNMIVVDEAGRFMSKMKNNIPALQRLICEGRGYGVSTVLIAQSPVYVPNDLIQNMNYLMVWPSVDQFGVCHGLAPLTLEYWERHTARELSETSRQWTQQKYHGLMTDFTETYLIRPDGSLVRPTGQEVEHGEKGSGEQESVLPVSGDECPADKSSEGSEDKSAGGDSAGQGTALKGAIDNTKEQ